MSKFGNGMKRFSIHMSVDGFMQKSQFPEDYEGVFSDSEGNELSPSEAWAFLVSEKARGRKVIPCSGECGNPCQHADRGCTGFDYEGSGCPGRLITEDA